MDSIMVKIDCESPELAIKSNLAEVQEQLEQLLVDFEKKEFKTLKDAKEARATLNKMFDALDNERKRAHDIIEKPYKDFLPTYNDAVARLNECREWIKGKCSELESAVKEEKTLTKKKVVFTLEIDTEEQSKIEKWLVKNGFTYKLK